MKQIFFFAFYFFLVNFFFLSTGRYRLVTVSRKKKQKMCRISQWYSWVSDWIISVTLYLNGSDISCVVWCVVMCIVLSNYRDIIETLAGGEKNATSRKICILLIFFFSPFLCSRTDRQAREISVVKNSCSIYRICGMIGMRSGIMLTGTLRALRENQEHGIGENASWILNRLQ